MSDRKRIYQLTYPANANRPVFLEDSGNALSITGIVVEGMGLRLMILAPWSSEFNPPPSTMRASLAEWQEFIRISDDPQVFEVDPSGCLKAVFRKAERTASGAVQQQVWARDGFACLYCGRMMGNTVLSVDHFVPLERGGDNLTTNLVTACLACNKAKGDRDPEEFCQSRGYDYVGLVNYLAGRASRAFLAHLR